MSKYNDEIITDITNQAKELIGPYVKYAAIRNVNRARSVAQDELIVNTECGIVLNPDWEGTVYFLFENGAEISITSPDYVSVVIGKKHK